MNIEQQKKGIVFQIIFKVNDELCLLNLYALLLPFYSSLSLSLAELLPLHKDDIIIKLIMEIRCTQVMIIYVSFISLLLSLDAEKKNPLSHPSATHSHYKISK